MFDSIIAAFHALPLMGKVVSIVGTLRVVLKPLQVLPSVVKNFVSATPSTKDDELLKDVEDSKFYKSVKFVIDWIFSVKLP
jgi:hypothetical protein